MTFEEFKKTIYENLGKRFNIQEKNSFFQDLETLASNDLTNEILRIQRINESKASNNYKTILLVFLNNENQLRPTLEWTALVKDSLQDPETADLYLFICYESQCQPSRETCLRIESTEQFCRKYVFQPNETGAQFIERTFFAESTTDGQQLSLSDPLANAFTSVAEKHSWFNEEEQIKWKDAFLSGVTGSELINKIFKDNTEDGKLSSEDNN